MSLVQHLRALGIGSLAFATLAISACAAPQDGESAATDGPVIHDIQNVVAISEGNEIIWNGEQVSLDELAELLKETSTMDPEPQLRFEPDARAGYEVSAEVLRVIKDSGVTKFGFVGNEKYRVTR